MAIKKGDKVIFDLQGMGMEFEDEGFNLAQLEDLDGEECKVLSVDMEHDPEDDDMRYFTVEFKDGFKMDALSGYHLFINYL